MDNRIQRYSVLGVIALCTLISAILADSLLSAWSIEVGEPVARGWGWLLGNDIQTFRTQTVALLVGVVLLGFALGGVWFFAASGYRRLRRELA